ncbi:M4 family metallopeptidase [Actinomadura barringtoniae]|uniref:Neutral metalloproteinase n=1 Tax=Actinomadura barringtoniae TaxID=1427535 RepID=A0A939P6E1_9ACTN|nr:M4 family metallopeptidase [Actinomadura barringtoniae]MBO2446337.1 M4 family metallopeptidase [Actinomadura barringtoniae]
MRRESAALAAAGLIVAFTAPVARAEPAPRTLAVNAADHLIATQPGRIHRSPHDQIRRLGVVSGARGTQYVAYDRTYAGLKVYGGDFVVVTDKTGQVTDVSGGQSAPLSVATAPNVTAAAALTTTRTRTRGLKGLAVSVQPRLVVLADHDRQGGRLAYETVLAGTRSGMPSRPHVLVDAQTGKELMRWDEVLADSTPAKGTANTFYNGPRIIDTTFSGRSYGLSDPLRPGVRCGGMDGRTYSGTDNVWGNGSGTDLETACTDAMYAAAREWNMLRDWLGRDGHDGEGRGFPMRVGLNDTNAYWDIGYAAFGHNSAGTKQATAIDVIAHELGHAVYQQTPGGALGTTETHALNESSADIFGTLTEWYGDSPPSPDTPDYLVAEQVDLVGPGPIRSMFKPSQLGDPDCFSADVPYMEPHAGGGVQNHWFYLLAEGSNPDDAAHNRPNSPTCNGKQVKGVGIRHAGQIFMETLNRKFQNWGYADVRRASLEAALIWASTDGCAGYKAVKDAWDAVNVPAQAGEAQC